MKDRQIRQKFLKLRQDTEVQTHSSRHNKASLISKLGLSSALIFATLLAFNWPLSWGANEFHYLSQALYSTDDNSSIFASGYPNVSSWLFIALASPIVEILPFELAGTILRLCGYVSMAVGLSILGLALRAHPAVMVLAISSFITLDEGYFGGEWIFRGIESKIFSYALGFASVGSVTARRPLFALGLAGAATLFHPLVGLTFILFIVPFIWMSRPIGRSGMVFLTVASVGGAVGYVLFLRSLTLADSQLGTDLARKIYTIVRHPHHVAPFGGVNPLDGSIVPGWFGFSDLLLPALCVALLALSLWHTKNFRLKLLNRLVLWFHLWIPFSLVLAWLDRREQVLGPLYLFRPTAPLLLISLIVLFAVLMEHLRSANTPLIFLSVSLAWLLAGTPSPLAIRILPQVFQANQPTVELIELVQSEVDADEAILVDFEALSSNTNLEEQTFELATGRGTVAVWKFAPTGDSDILRWSRAIQQRQTVFSGNCKTTRPLVWDYALVEYDSKSEALSEATVGVSGGLSLIDLDSISSFDLCRRL